MSPTSSQLSSSGMTRALPERMSNTKRFWPNVRLFSSHFQFTSFSLSVRQNPNVLVIGLDEFKEGEIESLGHNGDVDVRVLLANAGIPILQTSYGEIDGDSDDSEYEDLQRRAAPRFLPGSLEAYKLPPLQDTVYQAPRAGFSAKI